MVADGFQCTLDRRWQATYVHVDVVGHFNLLPPFGGTNRPENPAYCQKTGKANRKDPGPLSCSRCGYRAVAARLDAAADGADPRIRVLVSTDGAGGGHLALSGACRSGLGAPLAQRTKALLRQKG